MDMTSPWFLTAQANQMPPAQANVSSPIPPLLRAPVIPGGDRPTVTQAKSLNRSAASAQKPAPEDAPEMGLGAYLPKTPGAPADDSLLGLRQAQAEAKKGQQDELSGLSDYIDQIAAKPADINWTPLAAYLDARGQGTHYVAAAQAMNPQSQAEKDKMVADLRLKLLGGRAAMARQEAQDLEAQNQANQFRERMNEMERHNMASENGRGTVGSALSERNLTAKDAQAQRAADLFDKHPVIQSAMNRYNQIGLDRHTLETTEVITPQIMDELSQGIATALTGGRSAGLGQSEKQELKNIQKDYATLKQYTGKPMNALSKENRAMLLGLFDRLQNGYGNILANQAEKLRGGRQFAHNPTAMAVMDDKVKEYQTYRAKAPDSEGGGPKVGTIEDGHRFKGGDPSNPANWEVVK